MYGQLAGQGDSLQRAVSFFGDPRFKELPASVQESLSVLPLIQGFTDQGEDLGMTEKKLQMYDEYYGRQAERAQKLGKESLREATKTKMLVDLPKNVAQAFSGPASVMLAGMSQVPGAYTAGLQGIRPFQITPGGLVNPGSIPSYFS